MKYCPNCDNLLIPRKKKKIYCNACNEEFTLNENDRQEWIIIKKINHLEKENDTIIIKQKYKEKITDKDRKAYEEFF